MSSIFGSPYARQDWVELPLAGARLSEIIYFGFGLEAALTIRLADGREHKMEIRTLRVTGSGFRVDTEPWSGKLLNIRFAGDLVIVSARVACDDGADPDFTAEVLDWAVSGGHTPNWWAINAEFNLAPALP